MAIIDYKDDIHRDTNVGGNNIYIGNGQRCGTIWYKSVAHARRALNSNEGRIISGQDLFDCTKCSCYYSIQNKEHKKYPEFVCRQLKEDFIKKYL